MEYARALRVLKAGWTKDLRESYFRWFVKAQTYKGGNSFTKFVLRMKADAEETLTADEKVTLNMDNVPLEAAVRLTAEVAGASVVRMSNVLFITTEARADKLRPDADRPFGPVPLNPFFPGIDGGFGVPGVIGGPGGIVFPVPPVEAVPVPAVDPAVPPPPPEQKEERKER